MEDALAAKKGDYETASNSLSAKRSKLAATDKSIGELMGRRDDLTRQAEEIELDLKKKEHKIQRFSKEQDSYRNTVHRMEQQHQWIAAEKASFGKAGATACSTFAHGTRRRRKRSYIASRRSRTSLPSSLTARL